VCLCMSMPSALVLPLARRRSWGQPSRACACPCCQPWCCPLPNAPPAPWPSPRFGCTPPLDAVATTTVCPRMFVPSALVLVAATHFRLFDSFHLNWSNNLLFLREINTLLIVESRIVYRLNYLSVALLCNPCCHESLSLPLKSQ
jgi:hypothetical protein